MEFNKTNIDAEIKPMVTRCGCKKDNQPDNISNHNDWLKLEREKNGNCNYSKK